MKNNIIDAIFIDRDGTIGGTGNFIHPNDFELYPFTPTSLELLKKNSFKIFALTNQHRISRNEATLDDFINSFKSYGFDDSFICPHAINEPCNCKKPQDGLLLQAKEKYDLNLKNCIIIGDVGSTDMLLAHNVNCMKILVKTGWGEASLGSYRHTWSQVTADYVAQNLLDAVYWILSNFSASL